MPLPHFSSATAPSPPTPQAQIFYRGQRMSGLEHLSDREIQRTFERMRSDMAPDADLVLSMPSVQTQINHALDGLMTPTPLEDVEIVDPVDVMIDPTLEQPIPDAIPPTQIARDLADFLRTGRNPNGHGYSFLTTGMYTVVYDHHRGKIVCTVNEKIVRLNRQFPSRSCKAEVIKFSERINRLIIEVSFSQEQVDRLIGRGHGISFPNWKLEQNNSSQGGHPVWDDPEIAFAPPQPSQPMVMPLSAYGQLNSFLS